jgi:SAM-dependent methyltransferase
VNSYLQLCTEFYDIDKPTPPEDALAFYAALVKGARGAALEPMCGSGRFLIPLLEAGYDVDGVDGSEHMLASCRARCTARGFNPTLERQLLQELSLARRYALVFIPASSFSLIVNPAEARASLRRIHALLAPGGRLVLEVERYQGSENYAWPWGARWVTRPDCKRIICSWVGHYDSAQRTSYSIGRYELIDGGRLIETEFEDFNLRLYEPEEFRALLEECGYTRVTMPDHYSERSNTQERSLVFDALRE